MHLCCVAADDHVAAGCRVDEVNEGVVSTEHRWWRRAVLVTAALLGIAATASLGFWQLDRAAQKQRLQHELNTRSAQPPLAVAQLASNPASAAGQFQRRIVLRGQWIDAATVYLDNRQMNGRPGFFVMTPLQPSDVPDALIWVQRGWVPRNNDERTRLPPIATPTGLVEVVGRVAPPPARLLEFGADGTGPIRQNLDIAATAQALGRRVLPLTVVQTEPSAAADGLSRDWPAPAVGIHKHDGYAFQWFALSALIAGLTVWFQLIRRGRPSP
jgi:surfeit locus 1 family protein